MDRRAFHKLLMGLGVAGCSPGNRVRTWDSGVDTGVIEDTAPRCPTGELPIKAGLLMPPLSFTAYIGNEGAFRKSDLCEYHDPSGKTRLFALIFSGAWCGPCQGYARYMAEKGAPLLERGVRFLDILVEGLKPMSPANQAIVDLWLETYKSPMDTGISNDAKSIFSPDSMGLPTTFLIEPKTMKFIRTIGGFNELEPETDRNSPIFVINEYLNYPPDAG
jgi:hypothetical protein